MIRVDEDGGIGQSSRPHRRPADDAAPITRTTPIQVQSMLLGGRVVLRLVAARSLGCGPSRLRLLLANTR